MIFDFSEKNANLQGLRYHYGDKWMKALSQITEDSF